MALDIEALTGADLTDFQEVQRKNGRPWALKLLDNDAAGQNSATAQPWFPTAGYAAVDAEVYYFAGHFRSVRSAGAVSHQTGMLFGGTATIEKIGYGLVTPALATSDTVGALSHFYANVATVLNPVAATTSTTERVTFIVQGAVKFSGAGTFGPEFKYSVAPGGVPTINFGTHFVMWKAGSVQLGTWS